eukprot:1139636-Pelagomonas_calceolata.AAC.6
MQGFPTIKFVYADGDKIKTSDYNGQRSAKDLINFAFDKAKVRFLTAKVKKLEKGKVGAGQLLAGALQTFSFGNSYSSGRMLRNFQTCRILAMPRGLPCFPPAHANELPLGA